MVDGLITAGLGVLVTLMGFGKVNVSKDPLKNAEYLNKYGLLLRAGGVVLIAIGAVVTPARFLGN